MNADASATPIRWGPVAIPITTAVLIPAALQILLHRLEMPVPLLARYLVPVLTWAIVVFAVSCTATLKVEEPSLLVAFGDEYACYARGTSRWLPSFTRLRALVTACRSERGN